MSHLEETGLAPAKLGDFSESWRLTKRVKARVDQVGNGVRLYGGKFWRAITAYYGIGWTIARGRHIVSP